MPIHVTLQFGDDLDVADRYPQEAQFALWARAIVDGEGSVGVCIVSDQESARLNEKYRDKKGATNVLSFPFEQPPHSASEDYLGDIVMAGPLIAAQAVQRKKEPLQHWAHLFIHGVLHLRGYDHDIESNANQMEAHEVEIMKRLGFPNPYEICD